MGNEEGKLECLIDSGQQASDKCSRGRNWKYPVGSVECPESPPRSTMRQQRRIDQSMTIYYRVGGANREIGG